MASTPPPPKPKPTILVVPGAHHNAHHFHHVTHLLHQASYRVLPTTPPYYNGDPSTYKWRDDVDHIRAILEQELKESDVVVVMHSFGGWGGGGEGDGGEGGEEGAGAQAGLSHCVPAADWGGVCVEGGGEIEAADGGQHSLPHPRLRRLLPRRAPPPRHLRNPATNTDPRRRGRPARDARTLARDPRRLHLLHFGPGDQVV
ncbi:hypothetical protein M8818_006428 [Zalaria obscura]|uniref:Uncharacterized protein n=1 Tax=Zalaria obscura TaxID=2024903 RepID=A0ACC3S8V7_9PEZI